MNRLHKYQVHPFAQLAISSSQHLPSTALQGAVLYSTVYCVLCTVYCTVLYSTAQHFTAGELEVTKHLEQNYSRMGLKEIVNVLQVLAF